MMKTMTKASLLIAICMFAIFPPLVLAEPTIADYGSLPEVQLVAVSPGGNRIAFRRTEGDTDVLLVYSRTQQEYLQTVDVSAVQPRQLHFISDNELVLVASELRKLAGYRGEHDVSTAFALNVDTGDLNQLLTPGDNITMGQTGLGRIIGTSPDNRHLYMPALVKRDVTDHNAYLAVMKVDIASPSRPEILQRGVTNAVDYFIGEDGNIVAVEIYSNYDDVHAILVARDGEWEPLYSEEAAVRAVEFVAVTPDQNALVMLERSPESGRVRYSALSLSDGTITENIFGRTDADIEGVLTDVQRAAHGVIYSGFNPTYQFFDAELNKRVQDIQALFPDQSVWIRDWSDDWQHLVFYVEGDSASGTYYLFSRGEKPVFLASSRPNISAEHINPIVQASIPARDGLEIPTLLVIPVNAIDAPQDLPAVMLPHGGPQSYDRVEFDWLAQAIASQGYLVIQPQFRGSDGFGAAHVLAGHGEWGRKMQDDLTDVLQFLVDEQVVDGSRVCAVGWSYGGYAALAAGAFTPDLYRCVVAINGVSHLPDMMAHERRRFGDRHWVVTYFEDFMVPGEATREKLLEVSPANFADNFKAPVLLVHGENDETVPFEQSDEMYDELRSAGKDVQLIKLKDENHGILSNENRLQSLDEIVAFINRHIGAN